MTRGGHTVTHLVSGQFRLIERLGSGGMGTVWRAVDTDAGVDRALKEVRVPSHLSTRDRELLIERTRREARNAARLGVHPHVVTVHDLVDDHDAQWIIMDLVPGRSLAEIIMQDGALDEWEVARIGIALLDALMHGHRKGVLHRDVKPANVLITADGTVKLTDFGVAAYETDHRITAAGGLVGTPAYMAPECIRGDDATPASDLFSLAATLLHAVEGISPFGRDTAFATMHAVVYEEPSTPVHAPRTFSVLRPVLAKDPSARPTAEQLRRQVDAIRSVPVPVPVLALVPGATATPTAGRPACPAANAFYEAPTMFAMVSGGPPTDGSQSPRNRDPETRNRDGERDDDDSDTIGLEIPLSAVPLPRPRRPRPHSDLDPATIERPIWAGTAGAAAPQAVGTGETSAGQKQHPPQGGRPSRRGLLLAAVAVAGLGAGAGSAAWAARWISRPARHAPAKDVVPGCDGHCGDVRHAGRPAGPDAGDPGPPS
jgi:serine/threonine protein kinase